MGAKRCNPDGCHTGVTSASYVGELARPMVLPGMLIVLRMTVWQSIQLGIAYSLLRRDVSHLNESQLAVNKAC